ncbi:hypothetical protein Taro_009928 [Colocasia esculenta]|uniref:Uncharacterized protein n=1 Tax=Colocasia esculenta TaxID=4460 RepID=A0A843U834_COLES|nr:hypothetical protein [Colocasia esculenta]
MKGGGSTPGPCSVDERAAAAALLLLLRSAPIIITSPSISSASWSSASSGFAVAVSEGVCSRRRGSVAASEEEEEEEVPSPACSSTACSSSCIRDPPRSFAPVAEVQADPLLLLALAVRCVELKRKVLGVPFYSVIDTLISRFLYAFISAGRSIWKIRVLFLLRK